MIGSSTCRKFTHLPGSLYFARSSSNISRGPVIVQEHTFTDTEQPSDEEVRYERCEFSWICLTWCFNQQLTRFLCLFRAMITDPDMGTVEQQLAIQIGTIHAEFHDRLQLGEDEFKRNVNALEREAYEKGEF